MKRFLLALSLIFYLPLMASKGITITRKDLKSAGYKIFLNETGGRKEKLIHWNDGEEFISLGIGHFIWYPSGYMGPFDESFPKLINYYKDNNIVLPELFQKNTFCPWKSKKEFLKEKNSPTTLEAITFLDNTRDIQAAFIYERLEASLEEMLKVTDNKDEVRKQFYRVAYSQGGLYPLIDYVNFKGEGTKKSERYNNMGWGLLQVLEMMRGDTTGREALSEFSESAKFILARRVDNSPKIRGEERWLSGWNKRIDTYTN